MLKFVKCTNCGKTMPKHETENKLLDSVEPERVWCSQICLEEWKKKQFAKRGTDGGSE